MAPKVSEEHKEQRRLSILTAAKEIFTEKGYEAFVMQDVIEATGMSRGGVYSYFANKEDLFISLLEHKQQQSSNELDTLISQNKIWDTIKMIVLDFKNAEHSDNQFAAAQVEFNILSRNSSNAKEFLQRRYQWASDFLCSLINEGIKRGEFSPNAPVHHIARYYITFFDGLSIESIFLKSQELNSDEQIDLFLGHLGSMLGVK
ncbi:TetR/AcrR family transcriptional regulator [Fictibacillus aquaticus]|uniref:HTH tetR-type domain-containing protein n=1 Tax=Fictibacillus aquaticus TaxID=2021314 RepID=A0A235FBX5_9BACL|nr:TetR/AcrR family transcriptional regulator [Fictibacillus aquaticus]OYD58285.1 hypothetical protein CGZ90_10420 [Fictibacillus aquaticus]